MHDLVIKTWLYYEGLMHVHKIIVKSILLIFSVCNLTLIIKP